MAYEFSHKGDFVSVTPKVLLWYYLTYISAKNKYLYTEALTHSIVASCSCTRIDT